MKNSARGRCHAAPRGVPFRRPLAAALLIAVMGWAQAQSVDAANAFDIPAGTLIQALDRLGEQSGLQVTYDHTLLEGKRAPAVHGQLSARAALQQLLRGSGLEFSQVNERSVLIRKVAAPASPKPPAPKPAQTSAPQEQVTTLPEILVTGKRSLNSDIERTRDDVQPYVVFHREMIERSGAVSIDDFLKQRLPMNTQAESDNQSLSTSGNRSQINLRGLGTNQTLILIDGRRTSNTVHGGGSLLQQDLNGIPLAAIERIEVLPTTASGIYGGDATGGVINVILRRDYQGSEVKLTWDNSFKTDSAQKRIDVSTGFNLEDGKTNVMIVASKTEGNVLLRRDRDFIQKYRDQAFASNPNLYLPPAGPPLGYTPNIRSISGNLVLDDGTPLGSDFTHVPIGYAGAASDGGVALVANAGQYNFDLANSSQGGGGRQALLNSPKVESINATIRREFNQRVEGFVELAASNNSGHFVFTNLPHSVILAADAPNNPFQQTIQVRFPLPAQDGGRFTRNTDRRFVGGLIFKFPGDWLAEADYVWSRTSAHWSDDSGGLSSAGTAALRDGSLDVIRDPNAYPFDLSAYRLSGPFAGPFETTTRNPTLLLGGPVGTLPGGRPMLSVRLEHRDERFGSSTLVGPTFSDTYPSKSQTVSSAFAELRAPLFSSLNARPGVEELELQLSIRRDRYMVEGATNAIFSPTEPTDRFENELSSTNATAGFRWKLVEDVMLRASYGTGFLPPNVNQIVPSSPMLFPGGFYVDPRRGNTPTDTFELLTGGNSNLQPEDSKSTSAGLILTPRFVPGLRLSIDYTKIRKTANITELDPQSLIDSEALFPGRVTRGPNVPGDPVGWAGPITSIDDTLVNIARAEVEAYDLQLDYTRDTLAFGSFNFFAVATWQTHYKTQFLMGQPVIENVGFRGSSGPLKLKANTGITWNHRGWTLGWVSRYFDSYHPYQATSSADVVAEEFITQGSDEVDSQIYHDLTGQYQFGANNAGRMKGLLHGTSIQFGIRNLLNKEPPRQLETYSPYGDPRLSSYWLAIKISFGN